MLYKLTPPNGVTLNDCQWAEGITHTALGREGESLDTDPRHWLYAYPDPLLAVIFDPVHMQYNYDGSALLWEACGEVRNPWSQTEVRCTSLTTLRQVEKPKITPPQLLRFGRLCVTAARSWSPGWADEWLRRARIKKLRWVCKQCKASKLRKGMWLDYCPVTAANYAADLANGLDVRAIAHRAVEETAGEGRGPCEPQACVMEETTNGKEGS